MVVRLARHVTTFARHVWVLVAAGEQGDDEHEGDVPHADTTHPSPSRSPRYAPLMTRSHQPLWSRYQRTVWRSPSSKSWRGCQPSSRRILVASMAWRASWPGRSVTNSISFSCGRCGLSGTSSSRVRQIVRTTSMFLRSLLPPTL